MATISYSFTNVNPRGRRWTNDSDDDASFVSALDEEDLDDEENTCLSLITEVRVAVEKCPPVAAPLPKNRESQTRKFIQYSRE
jgi:hypothetical protein